MGVVSLHYSLILAQICVQSQRIYSVFLCPFPPGWILWLWYLNRNGSICQSLCSQSPSLICPRSCVFRFSDATEESLWLIHLYLVQFSVVLPHWEDAVFCSIACVKSIHWKDSWITFQALSLCKLLLGIHMLMGNTLWALIQDLPRLTMHTIKHT